MSVITRFDVLMFTYGDGLRGCSCWIQPWGAAPDPPRPRLRGRVPDDGREAFAVRGELGPPAPPPVAERLAWPAARAHDALAALAQRGCLLAHPDDTYELGAVA